VSASDICPCTMKSRRFFFLAPAHPGNPGIRAVKQLCMCVCIICTCKHVGHMLVLSSTSTTTSIICNATRDITISHSQQQSHKQRMKPLSCRSQPGIIPVQQLSMPSVLCHQEAHPACEKIMLWQLQKVSSVALTGLSYLISSEY